MNNTDLENKIRAAYEIFFQELGINNQTGEISNTANLKFASYPFIGSRYFSSKTRILFVGLDLGKDESDGILDLIPKRLVVENMAKFNTHMAGTLITTSYLLNDSWPLIKNAKSFQEAAKIFQNNSHANLLANVAVTNLFKFVTPKRIKRTGGENRKYINESLEHNLLLEEIRILRPHVVVFQSSTFNSPRYRNFLFSLRKSNRRLKIFITPHPSWHGSHVPIRYAKSFILF